MELVGSVTLGQMDQAEFLEKVKAAAAAAKYVNDNKIEYVVVGGPGYAGQNSNSVATTLIHAMGYKYPQKELSHLWAPGSERNLLPDDWKPDVSIAALDTTLNNLERAQVTQAIKDEKNPSPVNLTPELGPIPPKLHEPNKKEPQSRSLTSAIPNSSPLIVMSANADGSDGNGRLAASAIAQAGHPDTPITVVSANTGVVGLETTARAISNPASSAPGAGDPNSTQPKVAQIKQEMALA